MTETIVSRDGTKLVCARLGSGPALVLLGGAFSTRQSGLAFAPAPDVLAPILAEFFG